MATFTYKAKTRTGHRDRVLTAEITMPPCARCTPLLFPLLVTKAASRQDDYYRRKRNFGLRRCPCAIANSPTCCGGRAGAAALDVLARQNSDRLLSESSATCTATVRRRTLADAMTRTQRLPRIAVAKIRAGSRADSSRMCSCGLPIHRAADEQRNKLQDRWCIRPCVSRRYGRVAFLMVGVCLNRGFLDRVDKPFITVVVFWFSDMVGQVGLSAGRIMIVVLLVIPYLRTSRAGRMDRFKLKIPFLGNIMLMVSLCRFCRILARCCTTASPSAGP
jgi:hypothetical protein